MFEEDPRQQIEVLAKPDITQSLVQIVSHWKARGYRWPYQLPSDPREAAKWWTNLQEKRHSSEHDEQRYTKEKANKVSKAYWFTPYIDRLVRNLKLYQKLSGTDQRIVVGCAEEGIYWRGDDIEMFYTHEHSIYNETLKMRQMGTKPYIADAKEALSKLHQSGGM